MPIKFIVWCALILVVLDVSTMHASFVDEEKLIITARKEVHHLHVKHLHDFSPFFEEKTYFQIIKDAAAVMLTTDEQTLLMRIIGTFNARAVDYDLVKKEKIDLYERFTGKFFISQEGFKDFLQLEQKLFSKLYTCSYTLTKKGWETCTLVDFAFSHQLAEAIAIPHLALSLGVLIGSETLDLDILQRRSDYHLFPIAQNDFSMVPGF
ncbi:hypothetical protein [Candidatus Nucleicultrix amoebiphila]|uniref:Uncharacterized protein n=1 Tax=Candidatus Nucleicultrix amoebiphila FS5 TaxID=1414854 RepID=A0A1W6N4N5_9PROT|nr:hypothetical protein [Candidatus Nucleicultrix amoebiphila]ARN84728.1 hypothetical protein GQ61_04795 [Candidatus Nucleicultrix amoebiphila FS5]